MILIQKAAFCATGSHEVKQSMVAGTKDGHHICRACLLKSTVIKVREKKRRKPHGLSVPVFVQVGSGDPVRHASVSDASRAIGISQGCLSSIMNDRLKRRKTNVKVWRAEQ